MTLAVNLVEFAYGAGAIIATAESCTGGLVAVAITDVAGSSAVFDRGFVTYTNAAKIEMLGVMQTTLNSYGAVSEQVAAEMAFGAVRNSNATISVSITGIAGPGGSEHKPEGRVCFGVHNDGITVTQTVDFGPLGRRSVRIKACNHALELLVNEINYTK